MTITRCIRPDAVLGCHLVSNPQICHARQNNEERGETNLQAWVHDYQANLRLISLITINNVHNIVNAFWPDIRLTSCDPHLAFVSLCAKSWLVPSTLHGTRMALEWSKLVTGFRWCIKPFLSTWQRVSHRKPTQPLNLNYDMSDHNLRFERLLKILLKCWVGCWRPRCASLKVLNWAENDKKWPFLERSPQPYPARSFFKQGEKSLFQRMSWTFASRMFGSIYFPFTRWKTCRPKHFLIHQFTPSSSQHL